MQNCFSQHVFNVVNFISQLLCCYWLTCNVKFKLISFLNFIFNVVPSNEETSFNHLYGLYLRMVYISHSMLWTEISDPSHEGIAGNHLGSTIGMYQIYFQKVMYMCPQRDSNLGPKQQNYLLEFEISVSQTTQPPRLDSFYKKSLTNGQVSEVP